MPSTDWADRSRGPGWLLSLAGRSPAGLAAALAAREERAADRGVCAAGIRRRAKFGQPPPCAVRNRPDRRERTGTGPGGDELAGDVSGAVCGLEPHIVTGA